MSDGNPYLHYVSSLARLAHDGKQFQLGGFPIPAHPPVASDAPKALIFSPHPDDECIIGGWPCGCSARPATALSTSR